jgi:hypothetical protein
VSTTITARAENLAENSVIRILPLQASSEEVAMAYMRSPGYPSISLRQAVEMIRILYDHNRQNVTDRDAAAKDLGYKGMTGQSTKILADLAHYGLVERAGKGGLRVTDTAARIVASHSVDEKNSSLLQAAYGPELFSAIREQWPDGFVSENSLRSFLLRKNFATVAIQPVMKAYYETYDFLRLEGATESHRQPAPIVRESVPAEAVEHPLGANASAPPAPSVAAAAPPLGPEVHKMGGTERVVFVEEGGPSQYLKLVASGELDAGMLEALEDYIKRQKKRLGSAKIPSETP